MAEVLERKPVRTYLKERETLIPRKKLVDIFGIDPLIFEQVPIVDAVSAANAIEVVAGSSWARGLAEGVCGPGYAGFSPGTAEFDRCVYNVSHRVAARVLGMTWAPPVAPPPRPPRRRSPGSSFHVKYIDLTTGKPVEKTIPDIEQHELMKLQREGKISIISMHKVE